MSVETMSLREMGPQLKLSINVMKGSLPLQCNTYFPKILALQSTRRHVNFNLPSLMKILTDFYFINIIYTEHFSVSIFCL